MAKQEPYTLELAPEFVDHIDAIEAKYHSLIYATISDQLTHTPDVETRNRKQLQQPVLVDAEWEIRFGPDNRFRVFYKIDSDGRVVNITAVGVKLNNRLMIAGEEVQL